LGTATKQGECCVTQTTLQCLVGGNSKRIEGLMMPIAICGPKEEENRFRHLNEQ